jgi:hypothetical protein
MERAVALPGTRARRSLALPRVAAWQALAVLVGLSTVVRAAVGFARQTPMYFPDEYMYSELGRSIASSGRPLVRGAESSFPALLQPIITAPAWLIDDVATAYHVIQFANALAMSLAAVPVFLLARRVGVGDRLAVVAAAVALVLPDLLYAGWMLSEPFAYPLALCAALLAVRALDRPSVGAQVAFLAVAGLAAFARAQLAVLVLAFVGAALILGLRERALVRAVRSQWLVVALVAAAGGAVLTVRQAGFYSGALSVDLGPASLVHRLGTQSLALLYGSGWVLLPAAVLGLAAALVHPRTRAELARAAFTVPLVAGLVLQASLWGDTNQMQERYLFYCAPLLAVGFVLHAGRGWPWWRAHALLCGGMLVVAATVPLSGYAVLRGKEHAALLFALARADEQFGGVGAGTFAFGACAGALAVAAALLARTRFATAGVVALALAAPATAALGASAYDLHYDRAVRESYLPADRSWVDHAGLRNVALVYGEGAPKEGLEQLFWNRSVTSIVLMPGAPPVDAFGAEEVAIGDNGVLLVDGAPLHRPLLVDGGSAVVELRGAQRVARSQTYALWRPTGAPRLDFYARGFYREGWLANTGSFEVWRPRVAGRVAFTVRREAGEGPVTLTIQTPSRRREVKLAPGGVRRIALPACGRGTWRAQFQVDRLFSDNGRLLGVRSTKPAFVADPGACP